MAGDHPVVAERFALRDRVAQVCGGEPREWIPVGRGQPENLRWSVRLGGEATAFVKVAATERAAERLRNEYAVYAQVRAPYLPVLRGWHGDGSNPMLILKDLHDAAWPSPWPPKVLAQ
jgi:hypothetical protein